MKNEMFSLLIGVIVAQGASASAFAESLDQILAQKLTSLRFEGPRSLEFEDEGRGVVRLSGSVSTSADREQVARLAESTEGVKEVLNDIEVVPSTRNSAAVREASVTSTVIQEVTQKISTLGGSASFEVKVSGQDGAVALDGEVRSLGQRKSIVDAARSVPGVSDVRDNLHVKAPPSDAQLNAAVEESLVKAFGEKSKAVRVASSSGTVSLQGDFPSHDDVDRVLSIIVHVDGVKSIDSQMTVGGVKYDVNADH